MKYLVYFLIAFGLMLYVIGTTEKTWWIEWPGFVSFLIGLLILLNKVY